jgi:hypothetical protein
MQPSENYWGDTALLPWPFLQVTWRKNNIKKWEFTGAYIRGIC